MEAGQTHNVTHFVPDPSQEEVQHQAISLDTRLSEINISKLYAFGPRPPSPTSAQSDPCPTSCLHCNDWLESTSGTYGASRKEIQSRIWEARKEHQTKTSSWILLKGRHKEAFFNQSCSNRQPRRTSAEHQSAAGNWDLIIKIAGARGKRTKRSVFAYEAVNMQGNSIFYSAVSSSANTLCGVLLEAIVEAAIRARNHNFQ